MQLVRCRPTFMKGLKKQQIIVHHILLSHAFAVKLRLFERQISDRNAVHFPSLSEIISSFSDSNIPGKMDKYSTVLTSLITEFNQRFQDFSAIDSDIKLFSTPFSVNVEEVQENVQLELIELQCDDSLRSRHQLLPLSEFYKSLETSRFPLIKRHVQRMMSLFGSTYICEQTFSLMTLNKSPLRARLTDSHLYDLDFVPLWDGTIKHRSLAERKLLEGT
uniref:HAT C-terminal dimerisation domain-containing protein n=1 Tax=Sinocyclocheilus anshuiensis TaxID=1608454 RepID=A0A671RU68_9TELE